MNVLKFIIRITILLVYGVFAWSFLQWMHPLVAIPEIIIGFFTVFLSMTVLTWFLDSFTPFDDGLMTSSSIDWKKWGNK